MTITVYNYDLFFGYWKNTYLSCRNPWKNQIEVSIGFLTPKSSISGWWFGTLFIFHYIWDVILPIDELIFFKMVTTNQI